MRKSVLPLTLFVLCRVGLAAETPIPDREMRLVSPSRKFGLSSIREGGAMQIRPHGPMRVSIFEVTDKRVQPNVYSYPRETNTGYYEYHTRINTSVPFPHARVLCEFLIPHAFETALFREKNHQVILITDVGDQSKSGVHIYDYSGKMVRQLNLSGDLFDARRAVRFKSLTPSERWFKYAFLTPNSKYLIVSTFAISNELPESLAIDLDQFRIARIETADDWVKLAIQNPGDGLMSHLISAIRSPPEANFQQVTGRLSRSVEITEQDRTMALMYDNSVAPPSKVKQCCAMFAKMQIDWSNSYEEDVFVFGGQDAPTFALAIEKISEWARSNQVAQDTLFEFASRTGYHPRVEEAMEKLADTCADRLFAIADGKSDANAKVFALRILANATARQNEVVKLLIRHLDDSTRLKTQNISMPSSIRAVSAVCLGRVDPQYSRAAIPKLAEAVSKWDGLESEHAFRAIRQMSRGE